MNDVRGIRARGVRAARVALAAILVSYMCIPTSATLALADDGAQDAQPPHAEASADTVDGASADAGASNGASGPEAGDAQTDGLASEADGGESGASNPGNPGNGTAGEGAEGQGAEDSGAAQGADADRAADEPADEPADANQASLAQDIAESWERGEASIDAAGDYKLTADVQATAPLEIALPEGATATVDLAGYSVEVSGEATSAIDLTRNAGHITFTDSTYDAAHENDDPDDEHAPAPRASIVLKVAEGVASSEKDRITAVDAELQNREQLESSRIRFEKTCVVTLAELSNEDAYRKSYEALRTGCVSSETENSPDDDVANHVELDTCVVGVGIDGKLTEQDLRDAGLGEADQGQSSVVNARVPGVSIDGYFEVRTGSVTEVYKTEEADEPESERETSQEAAYIEADYDPAQDDMVHLASAAPFSYELGADFITPEEVVFGFPTDESAEGNASPVGVARAVDGKSFSEEAAKKLKAMPGCEAVLTPSDESEAGYTELALKPLVTEQGPMREGAAPVQDESADDEIAAGKARRSNARRGTMAAGVSTQATGTDLNAAWKAQSGGLTRSFTISKGGTYYLNGDLETTAPLIINAADQNITLLFNGHKLSLKGSSIRSGEVRGEASLQILNASSVSLNGVSTLGSSELVNSGGSETWTLLSQAVGCALNVENLAIKLYSDTNTLTALASHCVRQIGGTLSMTNCTVVMDMSNQSISNRSRIQADEAPSAVYASTSVNSVLLNNCRVEGLGTSALAAPSITNETSIGNAYALCSKASSTRVIGGSYRALSLLGNATCIYASSLEIDSGSDAASISLQADAGQLASGVLSTAAQSVKIDAPLDFMTSSDFAGRAQCEAALRSSVEDAFVFGGSLADGANSVSVLVLKGSDISEANGQGFVVGSYASGLDDAHKAAVCAKLEDALYSQGACNPTMNTLKSAILFSFDSSKAAAEFSGVKYSTVAKALDACKDTPGAVVTLLKNVSKVSVSQALDATIDLNNLRIEAFEFASSEAGAGLVLQNGKLGGASTVVSYSAKTPLSLQNVEIETSMTDTDVYGVSSTGSAGNLTLTGCSIDVQVARASSNSSLNVYGVYASSAEGAITIASTTLKAQALTDGVSVYGVRSSEAVAVDAASSISALGISSPTYAYYAGGALNATGTSFSAYASGSPSEVADVKLVANSTSGTDIEFQSCSFSIKSAGPLNPSSCACLLGSTDLQSTIPLARKIIFGGVTSFVNANGMHMGANLGTLTLQDDFETAQPVMIAQGKCTDDVSAQVQDTHGTLTSAKLNSMANLFRAMDGSYYANWAIVADDVSRKLVWHPLADTSGTGLVELQHEGSVPAYYSSIEASLSAAESGDTIRLLGPISEAGSKTINQSDLTIDLNGNTLTIRAGTKAADRSSGDTAAVKYTGEGTLKVKNGTLSALVGATSEGSSAVAYQGVSVSGGGTLQLDTDATLNVSYTGSTSQNASQHDVTARGVALLNGNVDIEGAVNVTSAREQNAVGALYAQGVFAQPAGEATGSVALGEQGSVTVQNQSQVMLTKNNMYAESPSSQSTVAGLREIQVDPETDSEFYEDILRQFQVSAVFDDPYATSQQSTFKACIYYAQPMTLSRKGAWYDGLKIWAFSDEVQEADVGKAAVIKPAHLFVSSEYEVVPQAVGISSGSNTTGRLSVVVSGSVEVDCANGDAITLDANGSNDKTVEWSCNARNLQAISDTHVHPVSNGSFDLRDYIEFARTQQKKRVAYSSLTSANVVRYESSEARAAKVSENVEFAVGGTTYFKVQGCDSATIEAGSIRVANDFALSATSQTCSIANPSGVNTPNQLFAMDATSSQVDLFSDAYGVLSPALDADGLVWTDAGTKVVAFKVGDAIVARYKVDGSVLDLSEIADRATLPDDQRQRQALLGWSLTPDEHVTSGYEAAGAQIVLTESLTYYAVFGVESVSVPVVFTNIYDDSTGTPSTDITLSVKYGETIEEALAAPENNGFELPAPRGYVDGTTGVAYRFVGWLSSESSSTSSNVVYSSEQLKPIAVTVGIASVRSGNRFILSAQYRPVLSSQFLVSFVNAGTTAQIMLPDGTVPYYAQANSVTSNSSGPSAPSDSSKSYEFKGWFVDADGDGEPGDSEVVFPSVLPAVHGDVCYTAAWSETPALVKVNFIAKSIDASTGKLDNDTSYERQLDFGTSIQEAADSVIALGGKIGYGGQIYTLLGWAPRKTDVEPAFDATNALPEAGSNEHSTYYGVYSKSDHRVDVTFYDGAAKLGHADVLAASTSLNAALVLADAKVPADKSESQAFLGWATRADADEALDGTSTMVEDVSGSTETKVDLYAIYGQIPAYTIRLRSDEDSSVLYAIVVKRGRTINSVLQQVNISVAPPVRTGKYFYGWLTAANKLFSFDEPVTGSANLYASYRDIVVDSSAVEVSAVVTSTSEKLFAASSVKFELWSRSSADTPISSMMNKNSYTQLRDYDMRLVATDENGQESVITGEFGTASLTVAVGKAYESSTLRGFWLGDENGNEAVMKSDSKKVDSNGDISMNIGNYRVGDVDEGGNLSIGYIDGGTGNGKLNSAASTKLNASKLNAASALSANSLANALSSSLSASLGDKSVSAGGNGAASSTKAGNGSIAMNSNGADSAVGSGGVDAESEDAEAEGESWGSEAFVMLFSVIALLGILAWAAWRLLVVGPRKNEAEIEVPSLQERYSGGLRF